MSIDSKRSEMHASQHADVEKSLSAAGDAVPAFAKAQRPSRIPIWIRYGIPVVLLFGGAVLETVAWTRNAGDATFQVMLTWYIVPSTCMLLLLWWVFLSGVAWKPRLAVVGVLVAAVAALLGFFRLKEFTGDMIPRFQYRWQESAEEKAADYWKGLGVSTVAAEGKAGSSAASSKPPAELAVKPGDWPEFEGPRRDGIARGIRVRTDWEAQPPRQVWRHPVGAAWSSFAVVGNYALTQEQRGADEAVVCYDAQTGKQRWAHLDPNQRYATAMAGVGPRATPTVSGSRVYTFGATGILNCLDPHTGAVLWSHNAVEESGVPPLQFGMSGSPLVYDKIVVVNPGGLLTKLKPERRNGRALVAYDRITGKKVWSGGDYQAAYASPQLATIGGVRQVVIYDAVGAGGYDAATGQELWRSEEWTNQFDNNIAQPIVLPKDAVFLSSGYGTGSLLFDVKKSGDQWTTATQWKAPNKFKLKFNSGVCRDGFVYGLDEGILACIDLSNGQERWKKGRYKYGQVLLLDNGLFVVSEDGDAVLVNISPGGAQEIARFHAIDGKTWNHPALVGSRLYVRNGEEAACYDLGPLQTAER